MLSIPKRAVPERLRASFLALMLATTAPAITDAAAQTTTPMQQVVLEALNNNPEIRAAGRERDAARERVAPAGALDDPMLEAGALNVPTNSWRFDREDMTMKMIGLAQRFPYPGKRGLRQDVATRGAESVAHGYQETVNRVARDARLGYLDLGLVIVTTKVIENNRLLLGQFLKIAEARYSVGQGSQVDVLKARTQLSRMEDELIKLARERPVIEAELNRVLGRGMSAVAPLPEEPQLRAVALPLNALREAALSQRPQLLALQSLVGRNERAMELVRKESYPDFDVRLSYGQRDNMLDGTSRSDLVSLTVAINLPVWRESKVTPRITEAQAMHEQALSLYEAQRNDVLAKLRQQVASAEQNLRSARLYQSDILPQARLTVEASLAAYRVNRVDFMALLDSQMTVFNYEVAYATAVATYNKALAEIDLLTGKSPL
jgi:cobalt-zinc-cadmium efflux system outer membrane protein